MTMSINNDTNTINVNNNLEIQNRKQYSSLMKLSSGLSIPTAKDDPAGIGISDKMNSLIKGLSQYISNAEDGISIASTAEGAMQSSTEILQRMRELSIQAMNGTLSDSDRTNLQKEIDQLYDEYKNISENTEYNGMKLLDGSFSDNFESVNSSGQEVNINIEIQDIRFLLDTNINISTVDNAQDSINQIDQALNTLSNTRADMGSVQYSFEHNINELMTRLENMSNAKSGISDLDYSKELSQLNKTEIIKQAGIFANKQTKTALEAAYKLLW